MGYLGAMPTKWNTRHGPEEHMRRLAKYVVGKALERRRQKAERNGVAFEQSPHTTMAQSLFDKNFDALKAPFKARFGIEWSANHALYMQFVALNYQAAHANTFHEAANTALNHLQRMEELLRSINSNLSKKQ